MSYSSSPAPQFFEGPDRIINMILVASVINAAAIFGMLYYLEKESVALSFFMEGRTLLLAVLSYAFRTGLSRDFGKFLCGVNIILALIISYMTYNGDLTDTGWETMDELVINSASEKLYDIVEGDDSDSEHAAAPAAQTTLPPAQARPRQIQQQQIRLPQIDNTQPAPVEHKLHQGHSIGN